MTGIINGSKEPPIATRLAKPKKSPPPPPLPPKPSQRAGSESNQSQISYRLEHSSQKYYAPGTCKTLDCCRGRCPVEDFQNCCSLTPIGGHCGSSSNFNSSYILPSLDSYPKSCCSSAYSDIVPNRSYYAGSCHASYSLCKCYQKPLPPPRRPSTVYNGNEFASIDQHLSRYETNSLPRSLEKHNQIHQNHHHHYQFAPKPMERKFRPPPSCLSPMPSLKNEPNNDQKDSLLPYQKCKPAHYRRFMEQHLERIFKYSEEREQRRKKCIDELANNVSLGNDGEKTILTMLNRKETMYLRSLRAKLTVEDFVEIAKLGSGYIGKVSLVRKIVAHGRSIDPARNGAMSELYAMKKLRKAQVFEQNHLAHVIAERDILAEADNEWIVKLFYSFQDKDFLYFIMEYIPGGDMMTLLQNLSVFTEEWARFYIAEISLAVQFVHDMGFIHRDIKPDNILIDRNGHIKLTDFGLCTGFRWTHDPNYYSDDTINKDQGKNTCNNAMEDDHPTLTKTLERRYLATKENGRALSCVGSTNYIAPEVLLQQGYSKLCDWWSVGVISYEMIVGHCPFAGIGLSGQMDSQLKIQERIVEWKKNLVFPSQTLADAEGRIYNIREEAVDFMKGLLCSQENRICQNGIKDMQRHTFFNTIDWSRLRLMNAPYIPHLENDLDTKHFKYEEGQFGTTTHNDFNEISPNSQWAINDFTYKSFFK